MGTLFGFAVGYVLGARTGNPGYERLREAWLELRDSRELREFLDAARAHVQGSLRTASDRLGDGEQLMTQGEDLVARAKARIDGVIWSEP